MSAGPCIVYHGPGDVRVEPMERPPDPGPGEVRVRVACCAICGTDVKSYRKGNPRLHPPRIMGHEFCGVIDRTNGDVGPYAEGQRVVMATTIGCGDCFYCRRGRGNLCSRLTAMGFHHDGGMAPCVVIPEPGVRQRHLVDVGTLAPDVACLAEPLSCAVNNLERLEEAGVENLLVVGLGPLGLLHRLAAADAGIGTVVGLARPGPRREQAEAFGFDAVGGEEDLPELLERFTAGRGFDAVVVTAPDARVQGAAPGWARKQGFVSWFASLAAGEDAVSVGSRTVHYGEQVLYGSSDSTPGHVRRAVRILAERSAEAGRIVTHRLPLASFEEGVRAILDREALKVVLLPDGREPA